MIICLEQCKDSDCQHMVQQMPLPCQNHIVHCRIKIHDSSAFLVYTGCPGKEAEERVNVCVLMVAPLIRT